MAYRSRPTPLEAPSPAELRSGWALAAMLGLALLAISFPQLAPQALQGILWAGAGILMIALPPEQRLPRLWWLAGFGFVVFSAAGFLPREWFGVPGWRTDLEALGLDTGTRSFVQPWLAAESWAGFAVTTLAVLFLLGHRVNTALHLRLALGFTMATGLWVAVALWSHDPGEVFGFFPNRNHTATLLAMGTLAGIGVLAQAIRLKLPWHIGLAAVPTLFCLAPLLTISESRAGIVLTAGGLLGWLALSGFRTLGGNVGKAIFLVAFAAIGIFLVMDSRVKDRLGDTVASLQPPAQDPTSLTGEQPAAVTSASLDARITIFLDTMAMVAGEPFTGVGPGQFLRVFPQHRHHTSASNDALCFHPESDWLWMLAETGWFATAAAAAGVMLVVAFAIRQGLRSRGKLLRSASLTAALAMIFHGAFDVPGHRIGLAWSGALLLALSLRPVDSSGPSRAATLTWRITGLGLLAAGLTLLGHQVSGTPGLPSVQVRRHLIEAQRHYDADQAAYEKAAATGLDYQPPSEADPLEQALREVAAAIRLAPLDPHLHRARAALALHYDDKYDLARSAQAIERRLEPGKISTPLEQAASWFDHPSGAEEAGPLWIEAMNRARAADSRARSGRQQLEATYAAILRKASSSDNLFVPARAAAGDDFSLLERWFRTAPAAVLDREAPELLDQAGSVAHRDRLLEVWRKRGNPGKIPAEGQSGLPPGERHHSGASD